MTSPNAEYEGTLLLLDNLVLMHNRWEQAQGDPHLDLEFRKGIGFCRRSLAQIIEWQQSLPQNGSLETP